MAPDQTPTPAPDQQPDPQPAAERLSILEARLAEIRARQTTAEAETEAETAAPEAAATAPTLSDTPAAAAVPPGGGATQTEADPLRSEPALSQSMDALPEADAHPVAVAHPTEVAATTEATTVTTIHSPAAEPTTDSATATPATAAAPGEAAAAPQSVIGLPGAVAATDEPAALARAAAAPAETSALAAATEPVSASQARAVAHYGAAMSPATENPTESAATDPAADHPAAAEPAAPVVALTSAEAIDDMPEGVASLPTSATDSAETAHQAELTHLAEVAHDAQPADLTHLDEAAGADEEAEHYVPETTAPDFAQLDLEGQAAYLIGLLRRDDARRNRQQINELSRLYEANVAAARAASRQKLAEDANAPEEFSFQPPVSQGELNKALQDFREGRARDAKAEDQSRAQNLTRKQELLAQLRQLVESAETKDSSQKLKQLQADWKATGPVPQTDSQETWNTYHGLLDRYYANQGRFYELKELDRRRNQEAKEALITRAEALKDAPGINKALDELKKLHDEWKHIGPVPGEQREPLWARFLAASEIVHLRRKEFVDVRSAEEEQHLQVKQALLERVLPFAEFTTERVNEWRSRTDELQEIKKEWEATGPVPRKLADALNRQYWNAYKAFFNRKNEFFKSLDTEKNANLTAKYALIEQAEAAQQNPDFSEARNIIIRVQKEWKDVGRVPEKLADKIWKRFRAACDAVFERPKPETSGGYGGDRDRGGYGGERGGRPARDGDRGERGGRGGERGGYDSAPARPQAPDSPEQIALLDKIGQTIAGLSPDAPGTLEGYRALSAEWQQLGTEAAQPGTATNDRGEEQLFSLMGKYLDQTAGITPNEKEQLLFQLELSRLKGRPQAQPAFARREAALRRQIQELENDVSTLQTNLDFFGRSKNADQLRQEYQGRMDEANARAEQYRKQLKQLRAALAG